MNEDRAARYHRLKRRASLVGVVWSGVFLTGVLVSGLSVRLRDGSAEIAAVLVPEPWQAPLSTGLYVLALLLLNEVVSLPLGFYAGFVLERRYGLSNERIGAWVRDQVKGFAVGLALGWIAAGVLYRLIRAAPDGWWMSAGVVFALFTVGLATLAPVVLLPLFYRVKPLGRESLRARLVTLAERAGARVVGVYELGLGEKTKKANAALTGIGATRRILVSDTMLADYSDDEIEVILAHELAHHVHGDIWKGTAEQIALILFGFFVASRLLRALAGVFGLEGPADVAGLPLLLLAAGAVSLVMVPAVQALSRANERRADRYALQLTRNPSAFISAMRRLGAQNLSEDHPSKIVQWLFYSHPPLEERIAAAQAFRNS